MMLFGFNRVISSTLTILVMLFALNIAGCSSAKQNPATKAPVERGSTTQQPGSQDPLQALYEAAKAEGKVIFWGPDNPEEVKPMLEAFKQKFPGIEVEQSEVRLEDTLARIIAEAKQGKVGFDVGEEYISNWAPLMERDLVASYSDWSTIFEIDPAQVSAGGKIVTWYNTLYPIIYNTQLVKAEDVPQSWDDLLDPKWANGKIILESRGQAFGYLGLEWGEAKLVKYLEALRAQKPIFAKGGSTVAQQLAAGAAPIAVGSYHHKIMQARAKGTPIDWVKSVSPLPAANTALGVMRQAPHPNAAKLWAGWLASREAQEIAAVKNHYGPLYGKAEHSALQDIQKHNVKVILASDENYKQIQAFTETALKALGVLK